ncbi:MAG TPA: phenylalanine--tRNA ligase subunit alpha [bacterium]|nr:phenylalanine--tRNA ligase subunit alpha [bacterium]
MHDQLEKMRAEALQSINDAKTEARLEELRVEYLGRKGQLTAILRSLGTLASEERAVIGALANQIKTHLQDVLDARKTELLQVVFADLQAEETDITLPAAPSPLGHLHPITYVWNLIEDIFARIGFEVASGPEVEWDEYNFTLLNTPKDHPARDTQDTFYLNTDVLLRTQTSPVQIRYMKTHTPPIRIIAPGRVYRRDYDMTHTPMFHQFEGLVVDEHITIADLKGTCIYALKCLLGESTELRFRPHFFPFTEPSLEVDVSCSICGGTGCRTCKQTGWLEMAGAGMVHPQVLRNVEYDPERVSGFAFGFGIDRIAMMRYGINDLRMMFENDIRFLNQL